MSIVMSINLKGGVAKTTTAVAVAECLACEGYRTLLIDTDHQCMSGELLLGEDRQLKSELSRRNLYRVLMDMMFDETFSAAEFEKRITRKVSNIAGGLDNLAVLPCSMRMDEVHTKMRQMREPTGLTWNELVQRLSKWRGHFGKWLRQEFDYVFIDCPPSFGFPVKFFLSLADTFIIPCVPDRLSVRGSQYLLDRIKVGGYKIKGMGTLWSLYRESNHLHKERVELARSGSDAELEMLPPPFDTVIPYAAKIAEAVEYIASKPLTFTRKYSSEFAKLFRNLSHEIVQRAERQGENEDVEAEPVAMEI